MSDSKRSMTLTQDAIEPPPPSYNDIVLSSSASLLSSSSASESSRSPSTTTTFKPIVISQTSSQSLRGAFMSPFTRAYAPSLSTPLKIDGSPITAAQFLRFLDGLNEALISSPGFQATSLVGSFIKNVPIPIIPLFGTGIVASAGAASAATCMGRAKSYVEAANQEIFLPRGLRCKLMKTVQMLQAVGHGSEVLTLPPLSANVGPSSSTVNEDLRIRRMKGLGNRVAELCFEGLPGPGEVEGWWKKLGVKEAQKKDEKLRAMLMQKREKGYESIWKQNREAEQENIRYGREVERLERQKAMAEASLAGARDNHSHGSMTVEENIQREMRMLDDQVHKLLREMERKTSEKMTAGESELREAGKKEQEVAQKLYWIVIDRADSDADELGEEVDLHSLNSK